MIMATVRHRLTRDDAQLVARLISRDSGTPLEEIERALADQGIDAVLDDPRLPAALLRAGQGSWASLPLFSYVMVRHALRRLGEEDRRLADYVAAVLMHFGMRDNAHRVSAGDDQLYDSLAALLADVDDPDGRRSFLVRTHLGNYALWLAGLFPDYIAARHLRKAGPNVAYYDAMGRRGFGMASDHVLAGEYGLVAVFRTAAERFPSVRTALNGVSDRLLFPGYQSPDRILRDLGAM